MSYAYRTRKKAIRKLKRVHKTNRLTPEQMPVNPHPPKFIGTLEDLL